MRFLPVVCVVVLAACAGSSRVVPSSTGHTRTVPLSGGEVEIRVQPDVRTSETVIPASPAAVWTALEEVYGELKIPVNLKDPTTLRVGNAGFETRGPIGGRRLSAFFSCGTNLTGEVADQRRIRIEVVSQAVEATDGARIQTYAAASARSDEGTSTDRVLCTSRGRLEQLIDEHVRLRAVIEDHTPATP